MGWTTLSKQDLKPAVAVLFGTRPGAVKMAPLVTALERRNVDYFIVHAGQHYSENMDHQFFQDLRIPIPRYHDKDAKNAVLHGEQTAHMLVFIERALLSERPAMLAVCGDANFNFAGALAARKLNIAVAHVESGLRSNDWRMPEEHNRVMIDHISDLLFCPSRQAVENLKRECVKGEIQLVGNTIVDAVYHAKGACERSKILETFDVLPKQYFLLTAHRQENVDNPETLKELIKLLEKVKQVFNKPIVFPVHPRTTKRLEQHGLAEALSKVAFTCAPVGYLDFLKLLANAAAVMTDSGGIQEEACILRVPCITLRDNTERPETVAIGANVITGMSAPLVIEALIKAENQSSTWNIPYGDGTAADKMSKFIAAAINP